jgi:transcriptional regulator with XRE-family HTH domain
MTNRASHNQLRDILVEARHKKGLTQVEIANRLGKPQSFVSKYESGERRLDVIEFIQVCKALNIQPIVIIQELETTDD